MAPTTAKSAESTTTARTPAATTTTAATQDPAPIVNPINSNQANRGRQQQQQERPSHTNIIGFERWLRDRGVRRKQSMLRYHYKRNAKKRDKDIPGCPKTDELLPPPPPQMDGNAQPVESVGNYMSDNVRDPYAELHLHIDQPTAATMSTSQPSSNQQQQQQPSTQSQNAWWPNKDNSIIFAQSTNSSERTIVPATPMTPAITRIHHRKRSSNYESIEHGLQIALVKTTRTKGRSRSRTAVTPSRSASNENEDYDTALSQSQLGQQQELDTMDWDGPEDGNQSGPDSMNDDCDCIQCWNMLCNLFLYITYAGNFVLENKFLLYPLALLAIYMCLGMLHYIMASIMATVTVWIWPPVHIFLYSIAGFLWRLADSTMWMDELGRSLNCDMATTYCQRYRLLCDRQCSFVDRAMERAYNRYH